MFFFIGLSTFGKDSSPVPGKRLPHASVYTRQYVISDLLIVFSYHADSLKDSKKCIVCFVHLSTIGKDSPPVLGKQFQKVNHLKRMTTTNINYVVHPAIEYAQWFDRDPRREGGRD